jgi:hypothetical protein
MHRRSRAGQEKEASLAVRRALLAVLCVSYALAQAASDEPPAKPPAKAADKAVTEKPKPRPRIGLKKNGSVGDDSAGGGRPSGASSMGGTPGTPSGSFTRP